MAVAEADSTWPMHGKGEGVWALFRGLWDVESARLAVWSPLLLVTGIWTYFNLKSEPQAWVAWTLLGMAIIAVLRFRHLRVVLVLSLVGLGFAAAKIRTDMVATPLLGAYSPNATVTGIVADIEHRSRSSYVIILDVTSAELAKHEQPRRLRLTWTGRKLSPPLLGQTIRVEADLSPLPRPALPGGFDYGRQLFFQSIGATGRVKSLTVTDPETPWNYSLRAAFHDVRKAIGTRIRAHIPPPHDAIADALITGERAAIPRAMNDSLIASGLFHILSISGLHMTLVAGGVFWAARAALALSPQLALRYPIKKWAAAAALIVGALYMFLADGGAATERAFLMVAVVFFAVMVDRPAISLHNLAVAAILILLWQPEQAVAASFQMSFLAVMGLAAFYPLWTGIEARVLPARERGFVSRWSRRALLIFVASLLTSLIAGSLSGLVAAHHFGRVAPFGIVSNALAMPVVGLVVMPMAMISVLLMPLGLEGPPLWLMGQGLELMMWISDWVASWQLARQQVPLLPAPAVAMAAIAAAFLCLPATRLRWGAVPIGIVAAVLMVQPQPSVLIDERGSNVALLTDEGIIPAQAKGGERTISIWQDVFADEARVNDAAARPAWTCDKSVCRAATQQASMAFLLRANETLRVCPTVDILIAAYPLRRHCKGTKLTIDRFDVWRNGAHAITMANGGITVETARETQGNRPWVYAARARGGSLIGRSP